MDTITTSLVVVCTSSIVITLIWLGIQQNLTVLTPCTVHPFMTIPQSEEGGGESNIVKWIPWSQKNLICMYLTLVVVERNSHDIADSPSTDGRDAQRSPGPGERWVFLIIFVYWLISVLPICLSLVYPSPVLTREPLTLVASTRTGSWQLVEGPPQLRFLQ